jgi:hypothetical protein
MSNGHEKKATFDRIALGCITYLESFAECRAVIFHGQDPASNYEMSNWEKKNSPLKLPEDVKKFYSIFNGFSLTWSVEIVAGKIINIGEMRVNRIDNFVKNNNEFYVNGFNSAKEVSKPAFGDVSLFVFDASPDVGEMVLLYRYPSSSTSSTITHEQAEKITPEVWFLDPTGQLHYVCKSFTQYLRLLVSHLGIYGWQMIYTEEGLPEVTQHWMELFCKERLIIDRNSLAGSLPPK